MAIMSNPPPKGMTGRAVKPLAWHRSERAPTDPALTAALTRCGTESAPPGMKRGGHKLVSSRYSAIVDNCGELAYHPL
jgi:hypothetical protein